MKIKFLCAAAAVATVFASTAAFAEDAAPTPEVTITGAATLASQYRFRGISQSDNKPVVQATITVAHKSGFYVSFWGSSASAGNSAVDIGGTEIDIYGGYTAPISTTGLTFDGGLYGYIYPGSNKPFNSNHSLSYYEIYGSLTKAIGPVSLKAGLNYAPKQDYFKDFNTFTKSSFYKYVEATVAIPNSAATLHAHLGHTAGGFDWAGKQVLDYTVGASYKVKAITLDASLVGANTSKADAAAAGWSELYRAAKPVGVLSLTASF